jgi:hypothetical protein
MANEFTIRNGFISKNNSVISGSLIVSNSINSQDRYLYSTDGGISVDWNNKVLRDGTSQTYPSVDWSSRQLLDSSANLSVDWEGRALQSDNYKITWNDALYPDVDDTVNLGFNDGITDKRFRYGYFSREVSASGFVGDLTGTASYATQALSSSFASTASLATTASYAIQALSASFASTSSFNPNAIITASVSLNTITFTKGDNSTFPITVNTGSSSPASSITQSFRLQSNALTFAGSSGNRFTLLTSPVNAGSEGVTQLYMEYGITLKQLLVRTTNSQPASGAITIALRKNGVDTALLVTIPANAAAGNFSSSADIPLVTGDLINYRINNAATATSTNIIQISLLYI